jgi:hypothetical protein
MTAHAVGDDEQAFTRVGVVFVLCSQLAFVAGADIQKRDLIGTGIAVALRHLHRITGIPDVDEFNAFNNTTIVAIEAGNYALGQGHD